MAAQPPSRRRHWLWWAVPVGIAAIVSTIVPLATHDQSPASAATYARNAWWVSGPLGQTLRITPSGFAQVEGVSAATGVMNNALAIAGRPPFGPQIY